MYSNLKEILFQDHYDPTFQEVLDMLKEKTKSMDIPLIENQKKIEDNLFVLYSAKEKINADLKSYTEKKSHYIGFKCYPFGENIFTIVLLKKIDNSKISKEYILKKIKYLFRSLFSFLMERKDKIGKRFLVNQFINKEEDSNSKVGVDTLIMSNITDIPELNIKEEKISSRDIIYSIYGSIAAQMKQKIPFIDIDFTNFPIRATVCMEIINYKDLIIKINVAGYYCDNPQLLFNIFLNLLFINNTEKRIQELGNMIGTFTEMYIESYYKYIENYLLIVTHSDKKKYRKQHSVLPHNYFGNPDILSSYISKNTTIVSEYMTNYFEQ